MSITIYWSCTEEEWLRAKEPTLIYKKFIKNVKDEKTQIQSCPSVKDYMQNLHSLQSIYNYSFQLSKNNTTSSNLYDQEFFNNHVTVRSEIDRLFSFRQSFVFFTEEKSLKMSCGIFPFLENNNITKNCITIPGKLDIGRWFRQLDFAFYLKNEDNIFKIEEDEIFQYIHFETKEKIIFKQYRTTEKIKKYLFDIEKSKDSRINKNRFLESYYSMFNHKKLIIEEIKRNLI